MNKLILIVLTLALVGCDAQMQARLTATPEPLAQYTAWVAEGQLVQLAAQDGQTYTLSAYTKVYVSICIDGEASVAYLYNGMALTGRVPARQLNPENICEQVAGR